MGLDEGCGYYPVYINLRGRCCLVVGGGSVAVRKAKALRAAGASVRVVAPMLDERLRLDGELDLQERPFRTTDLHGVTLVIVATDDAVLNRTVARDARDLGILVNVADCPALCSFILPATLSRGPVQVSVSTAGTSPALARKLRDLVERTVGPEYGELARMLGELRAQVIERVSDARKRAELFDRLSDEYFLELIRDGRSDRARTEMEKLIDEAAS